jgi:hypothetical protein
MRLGLLGDVHLNEDWALRAIAAFAAEGIETIIQVGDLGVWPGAKAGGTWNRIDSALAANGQTMCVAPGNHEDYSRIANLKPRADGWLPYRERILLAPRGLRNEFDGTTFVWLGGAGSIDRAARLADRGALVTPSARSWWPGEAISDADVDRTAAGGRAAVMVSHEAPLGIRALADIEETSEGCDPADVEYVTQIRRKFDAAFRAVAPRLLLHGHYHRPVDEVIEVDGGACHVVGLACDGEDYALGELDTVTLDAWLWTSPGDRTRVR